MDSFGQPAIGTLKLGMQSSPLGGTVIRKALLIALALVFSLGIAGLLFTANDATAQMQWPNCGNFLDEDDAQEAYEADRKDPLGLNAADDELACEEGEDPFGTRPLVSCEALDEYPAAHGALQGLYNYSLTKYDGVDQYNLGACVGDDSVSPVVETDLGQEPVAPNAAPAITQPSSVHPYVTHVLAGGVAMGVNAFGIVTQSQVATDGDDQTAAVQKADGSERRHDRHKANRHNKNHHKSETAKMQSGKPNKKK